MLDGTGSDATWLIHRFEYFCIIERNRVLNEPSLYVSSYVELAAVLEFFYVVWTNPKQCSKRQIQFSGQREVLLLHVPYNITALISLHKTDMSMT